jgi:hypothetical protein
LYHDFVYSLHLKKNDVLGFKICPKRITFCLIWYVCMCSLFGWLVADGWCWFVLREEYCWLVAAGCWWLVRSERKVLLAGG